MAILGYFQDHRPESLGRSSLCPVDVPHEGRCSFIAIGISDGGKWVFNQACTMPRNHAVIRFEVKKGRFGAVFPDHRLGRGKHMCKASSPSSTVISNALPKTRTQLGPSSSLDYRAGLTLLRFYTTFWGPRVSYTF